MCLTVYIASDRPLPIADTSGLVVRPIKPSEERAKTHFSKPEVHFIGAYTGCACGFQPPEDGCDDEEREKSLHALLRLLNTHAPNEALELYVSWVGRERQPIKHRFSFSRSELATRSDWCKEQAFVALAS